MRKLEDLLSFLLYDKIPPISDNLKNITIKFLPWIIIFFGIIGLMAVVSLVGIFKATAALTVSTTGLPTIYTLTAYDIFLIYVLSPLSSILSIISGCWMLKRQLRGWRLALIASLLGFIIHLLHFSIWGLVLNLIFIYLLFQIRTYYKR